MIKKIIFNLILILVLVMICAAIIRANKPKQGILKTDLNSVGTIKGLNPKEAKYYKIIEE